MYPGQKPADFAAYTAALATNLRQAGRMHALRSMILSPKAAAQARVSQVKAPALVVMGTCDPDFKDPVAETRWLNATLHAQIQLIEGAGHYPPAERPGETGAAVVAFLREIAAKEPNGQ